jgi:hypothetical protein
MEILPNAGANHFREQPRSGSLIRNNPFGVLYLWLMVCGVSCYSHTEDPGSTIF